MGEIPNLLIYDVMMCSMNTMSIINIINVTVIVNIAYCDTPILYTPISQDQ